jgi:hypothetical protein
MSEWMLQISGHEYDIKDLENLNFIPGTSVINDGENYFLKSDVFNLCTEPNQVLEIGKELVKVLNGIGQLHNDGWQMINHGGVMVVEPDGTKKMYLFMSASITGRSRIVADLSVKNDKGDFVKIRRQSFIERAYLAAKNDLNVQKAMRIYGTRESNWTNLYIIYEVIEEDVGGKGEIVKRGWATDTEIRRFKHTANSVGAVGDDARHGKEQTLPPSNPMLVKEAKALIETLMKKWIESK